MINDKFGIIKRGNIDTNNLNRSISEYDREVGEIVSYLSRAGLNCHFMAV